MTLFDHKISIFTIEEQINLMVMFLLSISIYYLAGSNKKGYYLAFLSGLSVFVVNMIAQVIRMETIDFLAVAIYGLVLVILLLVPIVRNSIIDTES